MRAPLNVPRQLARFLSSRRPFRRGHFSWEASATKVRTLMGKRAGGKGEGVRRSSSVEARPSRLRNAQATVPLFGEALCVVLLVHAHLWPLSPFRQWLIGAPRPLALLPSLPSPLPRILVLFPSACCLWPRSEGCARRCWPRPVEGAHETRALDEIREVGAVPYLSLPHSPMRVGCPALLGRKTSGPPVPVVSRPAARVSLLSRLKDLSHLKFKV